MFNEYEVSVLRGKNSRGLLDNNVNTVRTPRLWIKLVKMHAVKC